MRYGFFGWLVKVVFSDTAFAYMGKEFPSLDVDAYRDRVYRTYKDIVKRTPSIGSARKNMFVVTMYSGAFLIALYKESDGLLREEKIKDLVHVLVYSPLMAKAKEGKSAFTKKIIKRRNQQAKWSRDNIQRYPMNWFYYFTKTPGKDEYYITHKQCGICKLTKQEKVPEITKYLCAMDYYTFKMQGAVLDRTKTLAYGDDECNFHVMSQERAKEIGFVKSPDAK